MRTIEITLDGQDLEVEVEVSVAGRFRPATRLDPEEHPEVELVSATVLNNFSKDEVADPHAEGSDVSRFLSRQKADQLAWSAFEDLVEEREYHRAEARIDDGY